MKTAFVTDSGTGMSAAQWEKEGIFSVPLQIEAQGKSYAENETITHDEVIENLHKQVLMKTSMPSLGSILDLFESLKAQGYERVFAVPICRGLSGTLDAMEMAANQVGLDFIGFDCYATAVLQAWCIRTAKEMYEQGASMEEILERLERVSQKADTILLCDDLQHMKRGGRLTPAAALLGGLLKIKPVLHDNFETQGRVDVLGKVRTMSKAQDFVIDRLKAKGVKAGWDVTVAHVDVPEAAAAYAEKIRKAYPGITLRIIDLVSAVGIHTGLGCLALQVFNPEG
jgi:DegV family protein with EDD domain